MHTLSTLDNDRQIHKDRFENVVPTTPNIVAMLRGFLISLARRGDDIDNTPKRWGPKVPYNENVLILADAIAATIGAYAQGLSLRLYGNGNLPRGFWIVNGRILGMRTDGLQAVCRVTVWLEAHREDVLEDPEAGAFLDEMFRLRAKADQLLGLTAEHWLTVKEAAERVGRTPRTIESWWQKHDLDTVGEGDERLVNPVSLARVAAALVERQRSARFSA